MAWSVYSRSVGVQNVQKAVCEAVEQEDEYLKERWPKPVQSLLPNDWYRIMLSIIHQACQIKTVQGRGPDPPCSGVETP